MMETGASDSENNITERSSSSDQRTMASIELHEAADICQESKIEIAPTGGTEVWWLSSFYSHSRVLNL